MKLFYLTQSVYSFGAFLLKVISVPKINAIKTRQKYLNNIILEKLIGTTREVNIISLMKNIITLNFVVVIFLGHKFSNNIPKPQEISTYKIMDPFITFPPTTLSLKIDLIVETQER